LAKWIETGAAFPESMVDRIAPAVSEDDRARIEAVLGYRDAAAVVCEPFRQWVIEDRFAGEMPAWDRVGAQIVQDVEPFEIIKMRVLNGAQTALSSLGALCGLVHTSDDMADPVLATFVKRMLVEETVPTVRPVPGIDAHAYVAQSLDRLSNTAIRHRNHQIATDASQKIVQRILNPVAERLRQERSVNLLSVAVAAFMAYLIFGARRFGAPWVPDDPIAAEVAAIAEATGDDPSALVAGIVGIRTIFAPELAQNDQFRAVVASALAGLLSPDPRGFVADRCRSEAALP
jgi:fructuronate reductase